MFCFCGDGFSVDDVDALHSALKEFLQVARMVLKEGDALLVGFCSEGYGHVNIHVLHEDTRMVLNNKTKQTCKQKEATPN